MIDCVYVSVGIHVKDHGVGLDFYPCFFNKFFKAGCIFRSGQSLAEGLYSEPVMDALIQYSDKLPVPLEDKDPPDALLPCRVSCGKTRGTYSDYDQIIHAHTSFSLEYRMFAGLEKAKGDGCVVMDCDLQHPPEKVVEMVRLWEQGYEVVEGVKEDRGAETGAHRFAANSFYALISKAIGMDMSSSSDFKLLDRKVVDTLNKMPERNVFFRALSYWVGFRKTEVKYSVQERTAGESKWTTRSLIRYAIKNITSFSSAPLHCITLMGGLMLVIAIVFTVISLVQKLNGTAAEGFTTVIILLLVTGSLIMLSLGVIGYYISKMYEELKGRPRYIISEECGGNHD